METRGRKPKYASPETLRAAIAKYFNACKANEVFPDFAGMCLSLKVSKKTLESYCDPELHPDTAEGFRDVLEEAAFRRESILIRKMVSDKANAQGCLNALKQKDNGGYTDRPVENQEKTLNIKLVGVGGWDAFK